MGDVPEIIQLCGDLGIGLRILLGWARRCFGYRGRLGAFWTHFDFGGLFQFLPFQIDADGDAVQIEAKFPLLLPQTEFDVLACLHSPPSLRQMPTALIGAGASRSYLLPKLLSTVGELT